MRASVERLRVAAIEAAAAYDAATAAGVPADRILTALRLEHEDWQHSLIEMQRVDELLGAIGARTRLDLLLVVDDPLATPEEIVNLERSQGFLAFHIGKKIGECPYPSSSGSYITWRNGYLEAKYGGD